MAGVEFDLLIGAVIFLFVVWGTGRLFRKLTLPGILGELFAGIILGPNLLDIVPFASNGRCDTVVFPTDFSSMAWSEDEYENATSHRRFLASYDACKSGLMWKPRWKESDIYTNDIWSFAGTIGVTLLIMESGMHINFEKVRQIGKQALVVAIIGTLAPLAMGWVLVLAMYPGRAWPDGFAAGCALAPTSVGISIKLLSDAKMLNSMAGQTTLTAAFIDDVFSLVLLVLLSSLSSGNANAGLIILRTIAAFVFLGIGVVGGKHIFPKLDAPLAQIKFVKGASIQPRDEVHLCIMLVSLVIFAAIGWLIGSHLLGAFVAGMCFVNVPRSHQVWVTQLKRIIRWLIRIFFAATVGFAVPVSEMLNGTTVWQGMILGAGPGIFCKIFSGVAARRRWESIGHRQRSSRASIMTRFNIVQPMQYLVGMAMVARGEFAFLVAVMAKDMDWEDSDGNKTTMLSPDIYAALTWALVWALIFAPFLFKWALAVYMRASPIQRGVSIGGLTAAERNFVIQVVGQHHSGVLHEILNAIHGEGMDVLECRVETDGEVDTNYFVVQSRGKQKDFDDEKLQDIRHHITEILGDANAVVMFEAIEEDQFIFSAIELQIVSHSETKDAHIVSHVTKRLQELGLDVEEIDEQHKIQIDHGHETEMERDLFYAVPAKSSEDGPDITHRRVHAIKRSLQSMLRDEEIKAEVVVKPVADRSKGFTELQTFDPQQAIGRAKGAVWELLCFGPHDVELLSTACRKLETLGLRLLHAAHSHAEEEGESEAEPSQQQQQCSRFFVERLGFVNADASDADIKSFGAEVIQVLMTVYKSTDDSKFLVKPLDTKALDEMSKNARTSMVNNVPGLNDVNNTPDLNQQRRRGSAMNLKVVPDNPFAASVAATSGTRMQSLWGLDDEEGKLMAQEAFAEARASAGKRGDPIGRLAEMEAKVQALESLFARVGRLEELELRAAQRGGGPAASSSTFAPLFAPLPSTPQPPTSPTMQSSSLGLPMAFGASESERIASKLPAHIELPRSSTPPPAKKSPKPSQPMSPTDGPVMASPVPIPLQQLDGEVEVEAVRVRMPPAARAAPDGGVAINPAPVGKGSQGA